MRGRSASFVSGGLGATSSPGAVIPPEAIDESAAGARSRASLRGDLNNRPRGLRSPGVPPARIELAHAV
jgi:hypothetical protein